MTEQMLVRRWQVNPHMNVAVDAGGSLVLEIPGDSTRDGRVLTISNADTLKSALDEARKYVAIVYPSPALGITRHSAADRDLAYTALLEVHGFRQAEAREGERIVTRFLSDWHDHGHLLHRTMQPYALQWWLDTDGGTA